MEEYKIIIRGQSFTLTRDQIDTDSPNFFTKHFIGVPRESCPREIKLERNPALFQLIIEHLNGYQIVPLEDSAILPGTSKERMTRNLLVDATFYGLSELQKTLESYLAVPNQTVYLIWVRNQTVFQVHDSTGVSLELQVMFVEGKSWWQTIDQRTAEQLSNKHGVSEYVGLVEGYGKKIDVILGDTGQMRACWKDITGSVAVVVAKKVL